jgi:hypothetical protein
VTWFRHRCWFCGQKSRLVEFIVGDGNYQCVFDERQACEQRRRWRDEDRALAFAAQEHADWCHEHAERRSEATSTAPAGGSSGSEGTGEAG